MWFAAFDGTHPNEHPTPASSLGHRSEPPRSPDNPIILVHEERSWSAKALLKNIPGL